MINLSQNQVNQLEAFIQELPTKYGVPLLNLMRKFAQENAEEKGPKAEEKKKTVKAV